MLAEDIRYPDLKEVMLGTLSQLHLWSLHFCVAVFSCIWSLAQAVSIVTWFPDLEESIIAVVELELYFQSSSLK